MAFLHVHASRPSLISRGFTMIELLVVIAIIGLISMVILTGVTTARDRARYQSAFSAAKGMQAYANVCITDANVTMCMPHQATLGCGGSGTDSITGGATRVCSTRTEVFPTLPLGWVRCDSVNTGPCGTTVSQIGTAFTYRAKRTSDSMIITCTETGCSCSGTGCPNY